MVTLLLLALNVFGVIYYLMKGQMDQANFHLIISTYMLLDMKQISLTVVTKEGKEDEQI